MPLPCPYDGVPQPAELICSLNLLDQSPIASREIRSQTERDPVLPRVYHWVMHGWERHDSSDPDFKPYCKGKDELAAIDGILT